MRTMIETLARHRWINLFIGLVVILCGLGELGETLIQDLKAAKLGAGHGILLMGIWHIIRALAETFESFDYIATSQTAAEEVEANSKD